MDKNNYEVRDDGIYCCFNFHEKGEKCEYEKLSNEAIEGLLQDYRKEIARLQAALSQEATREPVAEVVDGTEAGAQVIFIFGNRLSVGTKLYTEAMPSKDAEWIGVNDKLPAQKQSIIGANEDGIIWAEYFDHDEPLGRMTHWMPLPAPPKQCNGSE